MAAYVAVLPPGGGPEKAVFVRDGFTFWAFLVPVVWFGVHRMWIEAALALAATLLLGSLDSFGGAAGPLLSLLFGVIVGLEAPTLRLWALARRGWSEAGVIEAGSGEEAEVRFFVDREHDRLDPSTAEPFVPPRPNLGRGAVPALGFLDGRSIA